MDSSSISLAFLYSATSRQAGMLTDFEKNRKRDENGKTKIQRWKERNREKQLACTRDWKLRNPDKVKEYAERRAEILRASNALAREILRSEPRKCLRCEKEVVWPKRLCEGCKEKARMEGEQRRYSTSKYAQKSRQARKARRLLIGAAGADNRITAEFLGWPYGCAWCGVRGVKLEVDHIIPVSIGGKHHVSNVVFACRSCNSKRGAMIQRG